MTLADLGASVLKIERPGTGDTVREAAPRYEAGGRSESVYFCNVNRNKASLALDLKSGTDRAELLRRVADVDVVVESFRPGTADRLGIGYDALRAVNPRIVYCAITGYGQTGDLAGVAGHDLNIAGMSGMLQMHEGQVPQMPNVLMADYAGSTAAIAAILAGIIAARATGTGSFVDVSMLAALSSWSSVHMTQVFAARGSGDAGRVEGWGGNPRYNIYRARDGRYLTVSLLERDLWARCCRAFGREDLVNPAETEADRLTAHGTRSDDYRRFLAELIASDDRDRWAERFRDLGLPICPVYTPEEWFASKQAAQRDCFQTQPLPALGIEIPQLGFPFHMRMADGSNAFALRASPPLLDSARVGGAPIPDAP